jgi:glutamyl-tRNA reductase
MSLLVVGVSHLTSDLDLLERVAVPSDERRKVLRELVSLDHVVEAVVLSTCNRVEVYVHLARFHDGLEEVVDHLAARAGDRREDFLDQYQVAYDLDVATHLFRVSGGLESMVVGERQIAMQVRDAMELARDEGTARHMLQRLFRQGVRVGRRLRNETDVSAGASSMVDVALAMSDATPADGAASALIVGAGNIGALAAARLAETTRLRVWNRSPDKAARLAARHDATVVADLPAAIATSDLVVCTTGAATPLVTSGMVGSRVDQPLTVLDLAMPHNVDADVGDLPGVTLVGLAEVRDAADHTLRGDVMAAADVLVDEEVAQFSAWLSAIEVTPVIRALRDRAEEVRVAEIDRLAGRLAALDDEQRGVVEALTQGIVNTFLHQPTIRLKERADDGRAQVVADALRDLFDLDVDLDDDR